MNMSYTTKRLVPKNYKPKKKKKKSKQVWVTMNCYCNQIVHLKQLLEVTRNRKTNIPINLKLRTTQNLSELIQILLQQ